MNQENKSAKELFDALEKIKEERANSEKQIEDVKKQLRDLMPLVNELIDKNKKLKEEENHLNQLFIEAQSQELKEKLSMNSLKEILNPHGEFIQKVSKTVNNFVKPYQNEYQDYIQSCSSSNNSPVAYEDFVKEFSQLDSNIISKNINPIIGKGNSLFQNLFRQIKNQIEIEQPTSEEAPNFKIISNNPSNDQLPHKEKIEKKEMLQQWINEKNITNKIIAHKTTAELHTEYKTYVAHYYVKNVGDLTKDEVFLTSKSFQDNLDKMIPTKMKRAM